MLPMKNSKHKGILAPILVTVVLVAYFAVYFGFIITLVPTVWKFILAIFPLIFAGVLIGVCMERIKEIRSGQEDDLSQY